MVSRPMPTAKRVKARPTRTAASAPVTASSGARPAARPAASATRPSPQPAASRGTTSARRRRGAEIRKAAVGAVVTSRLMRPFQGSLYSLFMSYAQLMRILWRHKFVAVPVAAIVMVVAGAVLLRQPPEYRSTATVALLPNGSDAQAVAFYGEISRSLVP